MVSRGEFSAHPGLASTVFANRHLLHFRLKSLPRDRNLWGTGPPHLSFRRRRWLFFTPANLAEHELPNGRGRGVSFCHCTGVAAASLAALAADSQESPICMARWLKRYRR